MEIHRMGDGIERVWEVSRNFFSQKIALLIVQTGGEIPQLPRGI
jgi:hypothetical protein